MFIAHDGETCKPPAFRSLEGFQHVGKFQLFEVKLESCVFWLLMEMLIDPVMVLLVVGLVNLSCNAN